MSTAETVHVRHGYALGHLHALTHIAVRLAGPMAADYDDRFDAARFGVMEHLCAVHQPPARVDLIAAGRRALQRWVRGELQTRGIPRKDTWAGEGTVPAFVRYWTPGARCGAEDAVVDRLAVEQILPLLTARQRQAFAALAQCENYQKAADVMGVKRLTFNSHISQGRARFLALWHEGEVPSGVWRMDKRVHRHPKEEA